MPRNITVTFEDGSTHVYQNAPDDVTPDAVASRAAKDFGKTVASLDGGKGQPGAVIPGSRDVAPPARAETPAGKRVLDFIEPTVTGLSAAGGGLLGLASPIPGGTAIGAGFGYGIGKGVMRSANEFLGYTQPKNLLGNLEEGAKDVLIGGSMEAGGQIAAPYIAKGAGWAIDAATGKLAPVRAGRIAREAIGPDAALIRESLQNAPAGQTAAQATANINSPTWQALAQRASSRDPRFFGAGPLTAGQSDETANVLAQLSGGTTQTSMRAGQENALSQLNERLIPTLKTELGAANTAGTLKPQLEGQANRFGEAAASKVEDVRRLTNAGVSAGNLAHRFSYMGELEKRAQAAAAQAADASLPFGEASRFAQSAADSLAAHGLKPLESGAITSAIERSLKRPEFAGNKDIATAMKRVASDISEWTNKGGVIDAFALDSIRKNSVNAAIRELYPAADKSVQKELAAGVLARVKPLIVEAIEGAGGTGYGQYLKDYAAGRQLINQTQLGAKASELLKSNPKGFVELVEGNSPKEVEKIFGPGNYDLAKQMSAEAMEQLGGISNLAGRGLKASEQAATGQNALRDILTASDPTFFKIPWGLSPKTMAMNKALDVAERRIGTKTMNILTEAMKSGKSADEMLKVLPAKDRMNVLKALGDVKQFPGIGAATGNALMAE